MKWKLLPHVLRAEAGEGHEGGGAAVAEPSAQAPQAPPVAPQAGAPAATARKPRLLELVQASVSDKASLLVQLNDVRGQLDTITAQHAALVNEKTALETELTAKRQELADIEAALTTARATAQTVEERALDIAASQGVPTAALPEGAAAAAPSLEDLMARLEKETDPKARFTLAQEIQALRWKN